MIVYHEVKPEALKKILKEGLKTGGSGAKSDSTIQKTDELLDARIPDELARQHVSRSDNLYGYILTDKSVIDIQDGHKQDKEDFIRDSRMAVLAVDIDPATGYVSDLDQYDKVKKAVENDAGSDELDSLAEEYWQSLIRIDRFTFGSIRRPEVMITGDIAPGKLDVLKDPLKN